MAEVSAWTPAGQTLEDEREVSTTEFIAVADGGLKEMCGHGNYWCLYTGNSVGPELPMYFLDNGVEVLVGKYAGTDEWIDAGLKEPSFVDFGSWLKSLIEWIIAEPFDSDRVRNTWG